MSQATLDLPTTTERPEGVFRLSPDELLALTGAVATDVVAAA